MSKQEQLLELQDKIIDGLEFALRAFQEGTSPFRDVTNEFSSFEAFVGTSILETVNGAPGYTINNESGETIFVQFLSGKKQIYIYFKDEKITRYKLLEVDTELNSSKKKLDYMSKAIKELTNIQKDLNEIEENQINE